MPEDKSPFISPKISEPAFYKRRGPGIAILLSLLLFFVSALLYGGLFLYKNSLIKNTNTLTDSLERARAAFDLPLINELSNISKKIDYSKKLLEQHTSPVAVLEFLEKNTLKDVRFKSFRYSIDQDRNATISLDGTTKNYSLLALQGDVFEKDKNTKRVSFSSLNLGEKGVINFSTKLILDSSMLIYKGEKRE